MAFRQWSRRAGLALWWTLSFQLPRHYRWWREARRNPAPSKGGFSPPPALVSVNPADIHLPVDAQPTVSILIPTYGQVGFTLRCLAAIARHRPDAAIEIIVVDDASDDPETGRLAAVTGIRLVRQTRNLGYLHTANAAAKLATGEFLLLLNNDTQVEAGWLDAMIELFRDDPGVGAVGSMLIYPDGRLQEAGAIVWADGSGWNCGRFEDPGHPRHNYVREVDYCSAACLLVRRSDFSEMGGFDPRYAPAYYEDTDLCFRLRARGLRVLYQPRSRVIHFEGVSHGIDIAAGAKAHQATNRLLFVDRWRAALARDHFPSGRQVLRARERGRPIVLVIDHYVPEPDRDAGSRNLLSLILALQQAGMAVKFAPQGGIESSRYSRDLEAMGIELLVRGAHATSAHGHAAWLAEHGGSLDLVLVSRPDVARNYLAILRRHTSAKIVYYGHDLHFARLRRQADVLGDAGAARRSALMERLERHVWRACDLVLYPSVEEAEAVARLEPGVLVRAVTPFSFAHFPPPRLAAPGLILLFVAGFAHPPNEDAAIWLVREILPLVRARLPEVCLRIVGSNPTSRVRGLAGQGIRIEADVAASDLVSAYDQARVAVVPLRFGAGVKLKVVEALHTGLPLVTTRVGAQGLSGLSAIAAVAADAEGIAEAICRLMTDDALWLERSAAQMAYARENFSQAVVRASLLGALAVLEPQSLAVAAE